MLSLADPENPVEVAFLPIRNGAGTLVGSHNHTLDWPYLYINQYVSSLQPDRHLRPDRPGRPGEAAGRSSTARRRAARTSPARPDRRPPARRQGLRVRVVGQHTADVIDVTNPAVERDDILQRGSIRRWTSPTRRSRATTTRSLLVTDEYRGGGESRACGKTGIAGRAARRARPRRRRRPLQPRRAVLLRAQRGRHGQWRRTPTACRRWPARTTSRSRRGMESGNRAGTTVPRPGLHDPHLLAGAGREPARGLVVRAGHARRRLQRTRAGEGAGLVHRRRRADTWSAKPHNGYIFTGDIVRGFDVLQYTGEDGPRWPTTAGPAEVQRAKNQGAPAPAGAARTDSARSNPAVTGEPTVNTNAAPPRLASGSARSGFAKRIAAKRRLAGATFSRSVALGRAAAAGERVTLTIRTAKGTIVSRSRVPVRAGAHPGRAARADHRRARDLPLQRLVRGSQGGGGPVQGGREGARGARGRADARLPDHPLSGR